MDDDVLQSFLDEGLITEVSYQLKSGKEATVWLCRTNAGVVAAKVYKDRASRAFHNDVTYQAGRAILEDRVARAVARKTRFGRQAAHAMWVGHEFATLKALHGAGADVPKPIASSDGGLLMSLVMRKGKPAPQLREIEPDEASARAIFDRLMWNIELMLGENTVHGDLSPFNILYGDEGIEIIDFPQAVDVRSNPNGKALLQRDITNVCRWAARFGVFEGELSLTADLWDRWERAML